MCRRRLGLPHLLGAVRRAQHFQRHIAGLGRRCFLFVREHTTFASKRPALRRPVACRASFDSSDSPSDEDEGSDEDMAWPAWSNRWPTASG